jgi:AcrR family transcriptional regulator
MTTPLARAIDDKSRDARATPLDVLRLARRRWLKGQRVHLADLAEEASIARATLFRWVGSKDLLMQEILWSLYEPLFEEAVEQTGGRGADHIIAVHRRVVAQLLQAEPLQRFLRDDPEFALRMLASDANVLHKRVVAATQKHLEEVIARDELNLPIPAPRFADILTRINRALLYTDQLDGRERAVEDASTIMRLLLAGQ